MFTLPPFLYPKDLQKMDQIYISNPDLPSHVSICDTWTDWQHLKFNRLKTSHQLPRSCYSLFPIPINDTLKKNLYLKHCKSSILQ